MIMAKRPKRVIYRIWNSTRKAWQFPDLISPNPDLLMNAFFDKIGYDALKWRFKCRPWMRLNPQTKVFEPALPKTVCGYEDGAPGFDLERVRDQNTAYVLMQYLIRLDAEWSAENA